MIVNFITQKLNDYIDLNCPNIEKEEVQGFLKKYEILIKHFENRTENLISETEKKDFFISFVWGNMANAVENNQGFVQGTFVFEDPDYRITNFFRSIAYRRISSHFKGRRIPLNERLSWLFSGYGVDAETLPAGHKTALFASVNALNNKHYSFLKIEEHPFNITKPIDCIKHSWRYIATRPRVWGLPFFRSEEEQEYREEDPPIEYMIEFKNLLKEAPIDSQKTQKTLEKVHVYGISGIWEATQHLLKEGEMEISSSWETVLDKLQRLQKRLKEKYGHLEIRKGNEVVVEHFS